jgi:hypothetical protein
VAVLSSFKIQSDGLVVVQNSKVAVLSSLKIHNARPAFFCSRTARVRHAHVYVVAFW